MAPEHEYNHFLKNQIVFVYEVNGEGNCKGVILERPTAFSVDEMVPGFEDFSENTLHTGGEDGGQSVIVLHRHDVAGSRPVGSGIFVGGIAASREGVKAGRFQALDFKFFFNHVSLPKFILNGMLDGGGWKAARLSDSDAVDAVLQNGDVGLWEASRRILDRKPS